MRSRLRNTPHCGQCDGPMEQIVSRIKFYLQENDSVVLGFDKDRLGWCPRCISERKLAHLIWNSIRNNSTKFSTKCPGDIPKLVEKEWYSAVFFWESGKQTSIWWN